MEEVPGDTPLSPLSCFICRKRKARCTRELPKCSLCSRLSLDCSYPTEALKPGRKKGVSYYKRPRYDDGDDVDNRSLTASNSTASSSRGKTPSVNLASASLADGWDFSWMFEPPGHASLPATAALGSAGNATAAIATPEQLLVERLSSSLELPVTDCLTMFDLYFENFGAFVLFRPRDFKAKLLRIDKWEHVLALVTAMFAWSARFWTATSSAGPRHSADDYFVQASYYIDQALADGPCFELLQASVLKSLYELVRGTHTAPPGCSSDLVRLATEMDLPNTDAGLRIKDLTLDPDASPAAWSAKEELRRCWWAIWELDVFLSGLRRVPNDIDWCANNVLLPVQDHLWFSDMPTPSCFMEVDPMERWKVLQNSQSLSPKAWYLVVNSMSHNAFHTPIDSFFVKHDREARSRPEDFAIDTHYMLNAFHCFCNALPKELRFHGEFLSFDNDPLGGSSRDRDRGIYSIHLMSQFTKFTLHHRKLFGLVGPPAEQQRSGQPIPAELLSVSKPWRLYLDVTNNVIALARNSPPHHVQFVHPLLGLIVWLAAAVLQVYQNLGVGLTEQEQRLVQSNYDALKTTFLRYAEHWNMSAAIAQKLESSEPGERFRRQALGAGDEPIGLPEDVIRKMAPPTPGQSPLAQRFLTDLFKLGR